MKLKQGLGYGALALITSPIWVPTAFVGYIGYKGAKFAFKNPKTTIAGLIAAGMMSYCASERGRDVREEVRSAMSEVTSAYSQRNDLEQRLESVQGQASADQQVRQRLQQELEQNQARMRALEERVSAYQRPPAQTSPPPVQAPPAQAAQYVPATHYTPPTPLPRVMPPPPAPLEKIEDPAFFFYYVKMDETLEGIARKVGTPGAYHTIARDNGVDDPRKLITGQLLRVRREYCTKHNDDVYEQVPKLKSTVLSGQFTISESCEPKPQCGPEILALNRRLGLDYNDDFRYKHGERVVYFK